MLGNNQSKTWSEEDDTLLRTMLAAGKSSAVIAVRLKRSTAAVKERAAILKLSLSSAKRKNPSAHTLDHSGS